MNITEDQHDAGSNTWTANGYQISSSNGKTAVDDAPIPGDFPFQCSIMFQYQEGPKL